MTSLSMGQDLINNNWMYGTNIGFSFNSSPPSFIPSSSVHAEGPTTMSDSLGNLLYYSNINSIKDKNHNIMPNSNNLIASSSCSQGNISTCWPGENNKYIYFHSESLENTVYYNLPISIHYSIIDMSLNSGNGDVVLATKNTVLISEFASEKMTITNHANGYYKWLIIRMATSNEYRSYLIDENGVSSTPVVSYAGFNFTTPSSTNTLHLMGNIKVNAANNKLAMITSWPWTIPSTENIQLMDFDAVTGIISNPIGFKKDVVGNNRIYGVEFSPNGNLLYVGSDFSGISQFDITSNNSVTIKASEYILPHKNKVMVGIQIGPDDVIYSGTKAPHNVACIKSPNTPGFGCDLKFDTDCTPSTYLNPNPPVFVDFPQKNCSCRKHLKILTHNACVGDPIEFSYEYQQTYDSLKWHFNNPYSTVDFSTDSATIYTYSMPGHYTVLLDVFKNNLHIQDSISIEVYELPELELGTDINVCKEELPYILETPFIVNANYNWNTGDTTPTIQINNSGIYILQLTTENNCISSDTIEITVSELSDIDLGNDSLFCFFDDNITLSVPESGSDYLWNTGSTSPSISIAEFGEYWIEINNNGCTLVDTIRYSSPISMNDNFLENDTSICPGDTITIGVEYIAGYAYLWSNGETSSTINVTDKGSYTLTITYKDCEIEDDILILNKNCCDLYIPNTFSPNDDNINDFFGAKSNCEFNYYKLEVYDRWGKLLSISNSVEDGWDGKNKNGEDVAIGVYSYIITYTYETYDNVNEVKSENGQILLIR